MNKIIIEVGASDGKHTEVFLDGLVLTNYQNHWNRESVYKKDQSVKYKGNYYCSTADNLKNEDPELLLNWELIVDRPYSNSLIYSFEPNRKIYNNIVKQFNNFKNISIYDNAIDIEETKKSFNVDSSQSSLYEYTDNIEKLWGDGRKFKVVKRIEVSTLRLDTFIKQNNIQKIDFLWIDAQGNDFNVLKSLGDYVNIVENGICEVSLDISLYKSNNKLEDVKQWLEANSFHCDVQITHPGREADIIFKKI